MLFFVTWVSYEPSRGFELYDQTTGFNTEDEAKREINRLYKDEQSAVGAYIVCHNDGKPAFLCTATGKGATVMAKGGADMSENWNEDWIAYDNLPFMRIDKPLSELSDEQVAALEAEKQNIELDVFPQDSEENEYRYFIPAWLNEIALGLTKGAAKHPGETWRSIPCEEHLWRAMRHVCLYLMGDRSEPHIINASMRLMMAFATARESDRGGTADGTV